MRTHDAVLGVVATAGRSDVITGPGVSRTTQRERETKGTWLEAKTNKSFYRGGGGGGTAAGNVRRQDYLLRKMLLRVTVKWQAMQ